MATISFANKVYKIGTDTVSFTMAPLPSGVASRRVWWTINYTEQTEGVNWENIGTAVKGNFTWVVSNTIANQMGSTKAEEIFIKTKTGGSVEYFMMKVQLDPAKHSPKIGAVKLYNSSWQENKLIEGDLGKGEVVVDPVVGYTDSISWKVGDQRVGSGLSPNLLFRTPGQQNLTITATSDKGLSASKTVSIYVEDLGNIASGAILEATRATPTSIKIRRRFSSGNTGVSSRISIAIGGDFESSWFGTSSTASTGITAETIAIPTGMIMDKDKPVYIKMEVSDSKGYKHLSKYTIAPTFGLLTIAKDRVGIKKSPTRGSLDIAGDLYVDKKLYVEGGAKFDGVVEITGNGTTGTGLFMQNSSIIAKGFSTLPGLGGGVSADYGRFDDIRIGGKKAVYTETVFDVKGSMGLAQYPRSTNKINLGSATNLLGFGVQWLMINPSNSGYAGRAFYEFIPWFVGESNKNHTTALLYDEKLGGASIVTSKQLVMKVDASNNVIVSGHDDINIGTYSKWWALGKVATLRVHN